MREGEEFPTLAAMILAGIDEAGYGPLLGPLVVATTVFRVAECDAPPDLWERLSPTVGRDPKRPGCIAVDDSKKLYASGKGWTRLEEGLLPFFGARLESLRGKAPQTPASFRELLHTCARRGRDGAAAYLDDYPWYRGRDVTLPRDTFPSVVRKRTENLAAIFKERKTEFVGLAAVPIEVGELNRELARTENKAEVSFLAIGSFLRRLWTRYRDEPVFVFIDRQGGRTHYARQLFDALEPRGVSIEEQGAEISRYRLVRHNAPDFRVVFTSDCESKHLPVALASMLAKYVRELHMHLFNEYWTSHRRDLRPTAGYLNDAWRFLEDTRALREELGTEEDILIRKR
ncbi:MAG TPA: hypothetical protein VK116_08215 [Planctomycetota bacterium]|nr:hypothetical protein [Planctomycetota bacterium]